MCSQAVIYRSKRVPEAMMLIWSDPENSPTINFIGEEFAD